MRHLFLRQRGGSMPIVVQSILALIWGFGASYFIATRL
jgi:hypothetical protein